MNHINTTVCVFCGHTLQVSENELLLKCPWCQHSQQKPKTNPLPPSNVPGFGSNVWMNAARQERERLERIEAAAKEAVWQYLVDRDFHKNPCPKMELLIDALENKL